jgi:hypothetical protein
MMDDLLEIQSALSRAFKRRVSQSDVAAFFGYPNAGNISKWYNGDAAGLRPASREKVRALLAMSRGEIPWPEGVRMEPSARGANLAVMSSWHAGNLARIEAEEAARKTAASKARANGHAAPTGIIKNLDQIADRQDEMLRRMASLEAAVNTLLCEWHGLNKAAS